MMNTISISLTLPDALYNNLNTFVTSVVKGNNNDFIIEAIEQKLETEQEKLRLKLIEGYQVTKKEDLALVNDFENVDYSNEKE